MGRIRFLPEGVISAIAAGEVVERPAIVVKELIENAIDADATSISIRVENAGFERITVSDNGHGLEADDLALAVERHTTSKIFHPEDLQKIHTLGFRGEALASIARVSRLTIQTRTANQNEGSMLIVDQGQPQPLQPVGHPFGTTVIVEDLFADHPARRKFLKTPASEFRQIVEVVLATALAHPEIHFRLYHNAKEILIAPAKQRLQERLATLFSPTEAQLFFPIEADYTYLKISGFLGKPQLATRTKNRQFLFVNGRPVTDPLLSSKLKERYGSLIEPKAEPAFVLHLTLHPSLIDVNIHPRKEQIRFMDEDQITELVGQAVSEHLDKVDLGFTYETETTTYQPYPLETNRKASLQTGGVLRDLVTTWHMNATDSNTPILQIDNTYLITHSNQGVVIVDQHAAHERILFEQFQETLHHYLEHASVSERTVQLSKPLLLSLSPAQTHLLEEHLPTLTQVGFVIETFGDSTFQVTHVPKLLHDRNVALLITQLLEDLNEGKTVKGVDSIVERTVAYLACRSAIKAGEPLTSEQRQELLTKLSKTRNQATCPHGRPTTVSFSLPEIEKLFKRR